MSAKIKLSYTDDSELVQVTQAIKPYILKQRISKEQKSSFKRAYFDLSITPEKAKKPH